MIHKAVRSFKICGFSRFIFLLHLTLPLKKTKIFNLDYRAGLTYVLYTRDTSSDLEKLKVKG